MLKCGTLIDEQMGREEIKCLVVKLSPGQSKVLVRNGFDVLGCTVCKVNGNLIPDPSTRGI